MTTTLDTFPVRGVTPKNAPLAHRVTECLDHLASYAAALADNAQEEATPIPSELLEAWQYGIQRVQRSITDAANVQP